ncbi:hypothetical protein [Aliiroseovarius crassostreae]|uniref:hypothetical protein n=1 Tax=Aliiroseovarius crassostreae TaxID=154981 RepID=UPI003C7A5E90
MNSNQFDRALWIIGRIKQLNVSAIWSQFLYSGVPDGMLVSFHSPDINRASIKASKVEEILDGAHVPSFEVLGDGFSFNYGQSGGQNYDHVFIEASLIVLSPEFCDELISETIADDPNFTQAHLVDKNYQYLQNIYDPLQFKALGLSLDGLPMKSNGLPFPLEQQIVDTDNNPGRYRLHQGYVEASAGYMWFGESFWPIVGKAPERIMSDLPKGVSLCLEKCWKLTAAYGVFNDQSTSGIQDGIRRVVFG